LENDAIAPAGKRHRESSRSHDVPRFSVGIPSCNPLQQQQGFARKIEFILVTSGNTVGPSEAAPDLLSQTPFRRRTIAMPRSRCSFRVPRNFCFVISHCETSRENASSTEMRPPPRVRKRDTTIRSGNPPRRFLPRRGGDRTLFLGREQSRFRPPFLQ